MHTGRKIGHFLSGKRRGERDLKNLRKIVHSPPGTREHTGEGESPAYLRKTALYELNPRAGVSVQVRRISEENDGLI